MRRFPVIALAALVAVVALGTGAGAQVAPTTTAAPVAPVGLSVTSDQPPYVITVPGENVTLASSADITCPASFTGAKLTFWAAPTANAPRVIDTVVVPTVTPGSPVPVSTALQIPAGTPQGTYAAGIVCEDIPTSGPATTQLVAEGWIVVGDANRLPPSDGVVTVPTGYDMAEGDQVVVDGAGFAAGAPVEVWMYSTPILLGSTVASAVGDATTQVTMPAGAGLGAHTVVLASVDDTGRPRFLTVGVTVGAAAGQAPETTTTTVAPTPTTVAAAPLETLPATGAGAGLAVPAVGILGLGGLLARISRRWGRGRERRSAA